MTPSPIEPAIAAPGTTKQGLRIVVDLKAILSDVGGERYYKAVDHQKKMCEILAAWTGADEVHYTCWDRGERYTIRKGDKTLTLMPDSNPLDGAWLNVTEVSK